MTNTKSLQQLVVEAQQILDEIRQHHEFEALDYHPDLMIGDAIHAVKALDWALQEPHASI
ncbi:hypothetical protein H6G91_17170 [Nostoc muscorum FACHB-395]|jgi:hypothetical protein|nr:hypothetical protein [Desmonostoc muscorum FACHB-395]